MFLAVCMLFAAVPPAESLAATKPPVYSKMSSSYKESVYYQRLMEVELTGNQINDLIAVASSQLGYREGSNKNNLSGDGDGSGDCTEYGNYMGTNTYAWCAAFVSWCFHEARIPTSVLKGHARCSILTRNVYTKGATWHSVDSGYHPKAGDLVLYEQLKKASDGEYYYVYSKRDKNGVPDLSSHVGIVVSDFNESAQTYEVIDGNGNQGQVKYLKNQKLYMAGPAYGGGSMNRIQGFMTPAYTTGKGDSYSESSQQKTAASYTLKFDAVGGSVSPSSKKVTNGEPYGDLPIPVRESYIFQGWYTSKSGGDMVTSGTAVSLTGDQTLYAQWMSDDEIQEGETVVIEAIVIDWDLSEIPEEEIARPDETAAGENSNKTSDTKSSAGKASGEESSTSSKPSGEENSTSSKSSDKESSTSGKSSSEGNSSSGKSSGEESSSASKASDTKSSSSKSASTKSSTSKSASTKSSTSKSASTKSSTSKSSGAKSSSSSQSTSSEKTVRVNQPSYYGTGTWITESGGRSWKFRKPNGDTLNAQWGFIDGSWYLFNASGSTAVGWRQVDGVWYFFYSNAQMATGWVFTDNHWYYLNPSGAMMTGWQVVDGVWYYLDASGAMLSNAVTPDGYWVNASGAWVMN